MSKLTISETFLSIQGEGRYSGHPSYFARTSGCNLRCWFCDTPYTSWKPEGRPWTPHELAVDYFDHGAPEHVVVTGGEPMVWRDQVAQFLHEVRSRCRQATIETNGTFAPFGPMPVPVLYSVSPKLASSFPGSADPAELERHAEGLKRAQATYRLYASPKVDTQWKFVVCPDRLATDLLEVRSFVADVGVAWRNVYLMPESRHAEEACHRAALLAPHCIELGCNLTLRVHVAMWGDRRGV